MTQIKGDPVWVEHGELPSARSHLLLGLGAEYLLMVLRLHVQSAISETSNVIVLLPPVYTVITLRKLTKLNE